MSKWKNKSVGIIQIAATQYSLKGLGDDSRLYEWDYSTGKWIKDWNYTNDEDGEE